MKLGMCYSHGILCWVGRTGLLRLVLFQAYVSSVLLYRCAAWGSNKSDKYGRLDVDVTEPFGMFYQSCLRSLMGVGRHLQN